MYKTLILLSSIILLSSCGKFLEVTPRSVATEKAFYKTRQDAIVAVNAAYNPLQSIYREVMWSIGESMSDNTDELNTAIDNFNYDAADPTIERYWQLYYLGVARCNTVLDRIGGIALEEELSKRISLEARFLRAFYYFHLVQVFGGVPLITREVTSLEDAPVPRASVEAVYTFIEQDLTAAEALPLTYTGDDAGRATRGAAKALLAKVYLTQKKWTAAAQKSKEVIDLGIYDLLPVYADNFKVTTENNKESLFEVQFVIGGQTATGNFLGNNFFEIFSPLGSGGIVNGVAGSNPTGRNAPTDNMFQAYESGDPRRNFSMGTSYVRPPETITVNFILKHNDPTATVGGLGAGSGSNWRVMRYAEVLLIYAEALNETAAGNLLAFEAINAVRKRARGSASVLPDLGGLDQAAFRDAVARERRVELAFEDHRWYDLLRTGKALPVMQQTRAMKERNVLLPIPQREKQLNNSLTQNPGYEK